MTNSRKINLSDASPTSQDYDLYQKREKIYQRQASGFFQTIRTLTIWVTLSIYFIGPWITWNGRQAILFDLPHRKFYIFDLTFWPQDLLLLVWLLIIAAFALLFFTNLAGRLWCGYTCPQTVWTTLFIWIEYVTEGNRRQRIKLDAQPLNFEKFFRKSVKHFLWFLLSLVTALTFVGYFAPVREVLLDLFYLTLNPWAGFWLSFFTIATYANAGWMREQVCIYMCPYGRFQSVMLDQNTLTVIYDEKRGEPRGSRNMSVNPADVGLGDCIHCQLCVQVCPTGIDIRNGLQYECIGCAACIDACNTVMDRMGYKPGLIRYTSENAVNDKPTRFFRLRSIGYGAVLLVMIVTFCVSLISRIPLQLETLRDRNQLYTQNWEGFIENMYSLKITNKTHQTREYIIQVTGLPTVQLQGPARVKAMAGELITVPVRLIIDPGNMERANTPIEFEVISTTDENEKATSESRFIGPDTSRFKKTD